MKTNIVYRDSNTVDLTITLSLASLLKTIEMLEMDQKPHYRPSKLTLAQKLEVQKLYKDGTLTQAEIGVRYGVSKATISRIVNKPLNDKVA